MSSTLHPSPLKKNEDEKKRLTRIGFGHHINNWDFIQGKTQIEKTSGAGVRHFFVKSSV
jgi:hypothetical protein